MAEDADRQEENKLDFDLAGEAVAYISLDQARALACVAPAGEAYSARLLN